MLRQHLLKYYNQKLYLLILFIVPELTWTNKNNKAMLTKISKY